MISRLVVQRMSSYVVTALCVFSVFVFAVCPAMGNSTNVLPYAESFEGYSEGESIVGTGGWYGSDSNAALVALDADPYSGAYPINTNHTKAVQVVGPAVTNMFQNTTGNTNVWIDFMYKPVFTTQPSSPQNAPIKIMSDNSLQIAIYFNAAGHLVIYHGRYAVGYSSWSALWTELTHTPVTSDEWLRITIMMDFLSDQPYAPPGSYGDTFFTIALNGGAPISHDNGWKGIPAYPSSQRTGPWFQCADSDGIGLVLDHDPALYFSRFAVSGPGTLDDLVCNNVAPADETPPRYVDATLSPDHTVVTLGFDDTLVDNTGTNLKASVQLAEDGVNFAALGGSDTVQIVGSNLVVTFSSALTTALNKINVASGALADGVGNPTAEVTTDAIDASADIAAPVYLSAGVDAGTHKIVTLVFDEALVDNAGGNLKAQVTIATNGVDFAALGGSDTVQIAGSNLVVTFNTALTTALNKIRVNAAAVADGSGNPAAQVTTEAIDASADIIPPAYLSAGIDAGTHKIVTLVFNEVLADNTGGNLEDSVLIAENGVNFAALGGSDTVQIVGSNLVVTFNTALTTALNRIRVLNGALADGSSNPTVQVTTGLIDASADIIAPAYLSAGIDAGTHKIVTLVFDEALVDNAGGDLKAQVTIATNGVDFAALGGSDTVQIAGSNLVVTFNTVLTTALNKIRVNAAALADGSSNPTVQVTTGAIDASADIIAPAYLSAGIDAGTHKIVTLVFDEALVDNTGGNLNAQVTIAADGVNFAALGGSDIVQIVGSNLVVTFNAPLTTALNKIRIFAAALADAANNPSSVVTTEAIDASADVVGPAYLGSTLDATDKIVTMTFNEALVDNTGGNLKGSVELATDGVNFAALGTNDTVGIDGINLVVTFDTALTAVSNKIRVAAATVVDGSANPNLQVVTEEINPAVDLNPPFYVSSVIDGATHKIVTMTFNDALFDNTGSLKANVEIAENGTTFTALGASDTVQIVGSTLVVTFNAALTTPLNKIRVAAGALADGSGNPTAEVITEAIDASADILAPAYLGAAIDRATSKIVTLTFDEGLVDNTGGNLEGDIELAADGVVFSALGGSDTVQINANKLVMTFDSALTGVSNKIRIAAGALKDAVGNVTPEIVTEAINAQGYVLSKMKITLSGYTGSDTLVNFPLLTVFDSGMSNFYSGMVAAANAGDLRFKNATEDTYLNHEIEQWDTNGESLVWVQVPSISGSSDYIWAYWGDRNGTNPPSCRTDGSTWSQGYAGVYHLKETGTVTREDSTANANDAAPVAYEGDEGVAGKIDGGDRFDGLVDGDALVVASDSSLNMSDEITLSAWVKAERWDDDNVIIRKELSYRLYNRWIPDITNSVMTLRLPGVEDVSYPIGNLSRGEWYYIAGTYDRYGGADNLVLYVNGVVVDSKTTFLTPRLNSSGDDVYIGEKYDGTYTWVGIIDEARICSEARSADWIQACWLSQASNSVFCTYGTSEPVIDNESPVYGGASLSESRLVLTLSFNEPVYDNSGGGLKALVQLATNGIDFAALAAGDTVEVVGSSLVVTFSAPLTTASNKIRVTAGALKDTLGNTTAEVTTESIYAVGSTHKMKITLAGYDRPSTLVNFPALVVFDTGMSNFYDRIAYPATASDLRFMDSTETVKLSYDIEKWDTSGESFVWVKVPSLSSSADYIWAYWGDLGSDTPPSYATDGSTWSEGFGGVWHLDEVSGTHEDSTPNGNDGDPQNGVDQDSTGPVDGADHFDGVDDEVVINGGSSLQMNNAITVSAWFKSERWDQDNVIIRKDADYRLYNRWRDPSPDSYVGLKLPGVAPDEVGYHNSNFTLGEWYYVAATYDRYGGGDNFILYVNGVQVAAAAASGPIQATGDSVYLGRKSDGTMAFLGNLDEARISSVARSADWVWACWVNQASNNVFVSCGPAEQVASGGGVTVTAQGTPYAWLAQFGITSNQETLDLTDIDGDGALTWEEYVAGTDPTNPDSAFGILGIEFVGGLPQLRWFGTTDGAAQPVDVYMATNLLEPGCWSLVDTDISRTPDGTNTWSSVALPPGAKVYYRLATTNAP